jgi:hypothetical protein
MLRVNMESQNINEDLMEAVLFHNVKEVRKCLENGADPNYFKHIEPADLEQPTTPLRCVMFCISDCLLKPDDLKEFAEVAKLLIKYGADPKPAMKIAESRYGKYEPGIMDNLFMEVWDIVANADSSKE